MGTDAADLPPPLQKTKQKRIKKSMHIDDAAQNQDKSKTIQVKTKGPLQNGLSNGSGETRPPKSSGKPLNFAPPKSYTDNEASKKRNRPPRPNRIVREADARSTIREPSQVSSSGHKDGEQAAQPIAESLGTSPVSALSTVKTSGFAPMVDPFPSIDDALSMQAAAVTLGDDLDRVLKKVDMEIENARRPIKTPKSSTENKKASRSRLENKKAPNSSMEDKKRTDLGNPEPRRRVDPRSRNSREQIPTSIFQDRTVTRGPHGRLIFGPSRDLPSLPQTNPSIVSSDLASRASGLDTPQTQHSAGPETPSQKVLVHAANQAPDVQRLQSTSVVSPQTTEHSPAAQARKNFFEEHINRADALAGVEAKKYCQGTIRIVQKARKDAWVSVSSKSEGSGDIFVEGERNRNRALNGDVVILQVFPSVPSEQRDDVGQDTENSILRQSPSTTLEAARRGKVIHILRERPLQKVAGLIRPPGWNVSAKKQDERAIIANKENKKFCTFHPQDQRIPWLTISQRDLPKELQGPNWIFNVLQEQRTIYAARIIKWDSYSRTPKGTIVEELGTVGSIEAETAAILADCDVDVRDHPASALLCLPDTPWSISEEEISKRRDFRKDRVCTIDPETARDLDDALSVRKLDDGNYEIGVHIADVSHFIEQDNPLDIIARERATTVYMVQKAIPMLPKLLCEELCSLNPAVDRLAFSVTWVMNAAGVEVGPRWYGRSVIRSAVRFAYGEAQNLLDGQSWAEGVGKPIDGGHTEEQITDDIKVLLHMSKQMRARRFENGALTMSAFKLNFGLKKDGLPAVAEVYQLKDANRLIEEFMLKANISVAEKLVEVFPEHSLLRKHSEPKEKSLKDFVAYAHKLGIDIDASSSATMQEGFNNLSEVAKDNPMVGVLQNNAVRSMQRAEYMCTGSHEDQSSWAHYALAVPLYTHFTSPIRRYADVIVHRLLDRALKEAEPGFLADDCEEWAKNCNVRKENARAAQERSSMLYLCAYIEDFCLRNDAMGTDSGMVVDAIIVTVRDRSVDVIVPSMALEKRLYYDDSYSINDFKHSARNESTEVSWRTSEQRSTAIRKADTAVDSETLNSSQASSIGEASGPDHNQQAPTHLRGEAASTEASAMHENNQSEFSSEMIAKGQDRSNILPASDTLPESAADGVSAVVDVHKTVLKVMSPLKVWLRGDFSESPCQVTAGFVPPYLW